MAPLDGHKRGARRARAGRCKIRYRSAVRIRPRSDDRHSTPQRNEESPPCPSPVEPRSCPASTCCSAAASPRWRRPAAAPAPRPAPAKEHFEVEMTDDQWKAKLSPQAYAVLRHEGTETPFTSPLNDEHRKGTFTCAGCALALFSSDDQVRQRHRLAQLLAAAAQRRQPARRHHAGHVARRGALPPLRRPPGPRVRRRPEAHRPALLHERRRDGVHAGLTPHLYPKDIPP